MARQLSPPIRSTGLLRLTPRVTRLITEPLRVLFNTSAMGMACTSHGSIGRRIIRTDMGMADTVVMELDTVVTVLGMGAMAGVAWDSVDMAMAIGLGMAAMVIRTQAITLPVSPRMGWVGVIHTISACS